MPDESDRVAVSTYVPTSQRDAWREDAERMGMSQSEFVRTMVQAGRRGFTFADQTPDPVEAPPSGSTPRGDGLKTTVLDLLGDGGALDWDDLVREVTGDVEDRLESAVDELMSRNRITYKGRRGGYTITGSADGE